MERITDEQGEQRQTGKIISTRVDLVLPVSELKLNVEPAPRKIDFYEKCFRECYDNLRAIDENLPESSLDTYGLARLAAGEEIDINAELTAEIQA
ncbi:3809_t:CDS:2 [Entrophospora sp. SA101]|nr:3809_t:CDS:2 [Entrophospora sp. SA101]